MKKKCYEGNSLFWSLEEITSKTDNVIKLIGRYCFLCYEIDTNPLPALRKRYPQYKWEFIQCGEYLSDLLIRIKSLDFVWSVGSMKYVVATHKAKSMQGPIRVFWSDEYTTELYQRTIPDLIQEIEALGFKVSGIP